MATRNIQAGDLERVLRELVRGGERIDSVYSNGDGWMVVTEDRIETRGGAA